MTREHAKKKKTEDGSTHDPSRDNARYMLHVHHRTMLDICYTYIFWRYDTLAYRKKTKDGTTHDPSRQCYIYITRNFFGLNMSHISNGYKIIILEDTPDRVPVFSN